MDSPTGSTTLENNSMRRRSMSHLDEGTSGATKCHSRLTLVASDMVCLQGNRLTPRTCFTRKVVQWRNTQHIRKCTLRHMDQFRQVCNASAIISGQLTQYRISSATLNISSLMVLPSQFNLNVLTRTSQRRPL